MDNVKYQYVKKNTKPLEFVIFILTIIFQFYNIYIVFNETKQFTDFSVEQGVLRFELASIIILLIVSFVLMIVTAISKVRGLSSIVFLMPIFKEIIGSLFYWRRGVYYIGHPEELFVPLALTILICLIIIALFMCYMNIEKIAKSLKPITTIVLFLGMADMIWVATDLNWYAVLEVSVPICILIGFEIALSFCAYKTVEFLDYDSTNVIVKSSNEIVETIREYKELLHLGIISQDEFDKKKKELLNN